METFIHINNVSVRTMKTVKLYMLNLCYRQNNVNTNCNQPYLIGLECLGNINILLWSTPQENNNNNKGMHDLSPIIKQFVFMLWNQNKHQNNGLWSILLNIVTNLPWFLFISPFGSQNVSTGVCEVCLFILRLIA